MVELKEKELVIRIETNFPEEDLNELQNCLLQTISNTTNEYLNQDVIFPLCNFMQALLPSTDQLKKLKK